MTDEEITEFATSLIIDHARTVEYLTIHEMAYELLGHEISDGVANRVADLIVSATITVEWSAG